MPASVRTTRAVFTRLLTPAETGCQATFAHNFDLTGDKSPFHSSYERGCQEKTLLHSLRETSIGACIQALLLRGEGVGSNAWSATECDRDTDRSCWSPVSGFMQRSRHHSLRSCASQPLA